MNEIAQARQAQLENQQQQMERQQVQKELAAAIAKLGNYFTLCLLALFIKNIYIYSFFFVIFFLYFLFFK